MEHSFPSPSTAATGVISLDERKQAVYGGERKRKLH